MDNALTSVAGSPPPAPNPNPDPGQNALASPTPGQPQAASAPQAPAPSHQQTAAALRHFGAIEKELTGLLKDPDCGKADMRSQIIDGASRLVAQGIMPASQAVTQLGSVPDRPFDQKQWLMQQYGQAVQAQTAILGHHAEAFLGQEDMPAGEGSDDDHATVMAGLLNHYKSRGHG